VNVVITGGAGFLGSRLARRLLENGTLKNATGEPTRIERITLVDVVAPAPSSDARVVSLVGDVSDPALIERAIDARTSSIFHLAAIVSGMAEADFDVGMRINIDASRALLEVCRRLGHCPKVVFTSSVAVYGGELPDVVLDTTALRPQSSYGMQKAVGELLLGDYTRRGFVDGRVLRLPTISVRPGRPNAAASSFASGIVREPLNGEEAVCPVPPDTRLWLLSPATAIECLIAGHDLPSDALGSNRCVNVPGLSVSVEEMVAALERQAGRNVTTRIRWARDARIERIVATWPGAWDTSRAHALGFPNDDSFDTIVRRYMDEVGLP
jgi:nucleoside-diphosphate-sugar epimerase